MKQNSIKKTVNGWKKADKFISAEKQKSLSEMSQKESRKIYEVLLDTWENNRNDTGDIKNIEKMRRKETVSLRKKLDKVYWKTKN